MFKHVKVLQLEPWMKWVVDKDGTDDPIEYYADEVRTEYNRDGYYYNRFTQIEWFEYKGKAWKLKRPGMFMFKLEQLNHTPLSQEERQAFTLLGQNHRFGGFHKKFVNLLSTDKHWYEIREIGRSARISRKRILGKLQEKHQNGSNNKLT